MLCLFSARKRTRKAIDAEGQDAVLQDLLAAQDEDMVMQETLQGRPGEIFEARMMRMMRMMTVVMREVAESNKLNRQLAKDNAMLREELSELRSQSGRSYASTLKSGTSARTSKSVTWATLSEGSLASN